MYTQPRVPENSRRRRKKEIMPQKLLLISMLAILFGLTTNITHAQMPRIISIGPEEAAGPAGRLSSIATDTASQPHIVCDGGSFAYQYDKVGASWRTTTFDTSTLGSHQYYNPHIEIDAANRAWVSGVLFGEAVGLGIIVRTDMSTAPSADYFTIIRIQGAWDDGNLSLDPGTPGYMVASGASGFWRQYVYDISKSGRISDVNNGQMWAGEGGEKNAFWISKAGNVRHPNGASHAIWHGAIGGWDGWSSSYQNSIRQGQGLSTVTWANFAQYPKQADDGTYVDLVSDNLDPQIAYMTSDFGSGQGICMNIWNGNSMVFDPASILSVDPNGTCGTRRYAPQLTPANGGGVFICWTRADRIKVRYISPAGEMGPETDVGQGSLGAICTDSEGDLHVVYNRDGIRYRKLTVFDSRTISTPVFTGDYDGDGQSDIAVFRPAEGNWYILQSRDGAITKNWGNVRDVPMPYDFDGDGKTDIAVFRRQNGTWYIWGSKGAYIPPKQFGATDDVPVPGDYDGDGKVDITVYNLNEGKWYTLRSSDAQVQGTVWGLGTDIPVPADYDGDHKTDIAVFRPSNGTWYIWRSTMGPLQVQWGAPSDVPAPEDYDGDGKADIAVIRRATGMWYIWGSQRGPIQQQWGAPGDVPVPGKFDTDSKTDIAIYRPGTCQWYILRSSDNKLKGIAPVLWGLGTDRAVPRDYNGDGKTEIAVFRAGTGAWYIRDLQNSIWGAPGDIAAPEDYDNDGKTDLAIFRPANGMWYIWGSSKGYREHQWGAPGDQPVPADYDGDGTNNIAVFRSGNGTWYVRGSNGALITQCWGAPGDIPTPADYDNDGMADYAVFRPANGTWYIWRSSKGYTEQQWGAPGDIPVPADYDLDGTNDLAVFRPANGTWYIWRSSKGYLAQQWGAPGDIPLPADYDLDGKIDFAVFRNAGYGTWWIWKSSTGEIMEENGPINWGAPGDIPIGARDKAL
jgi:hypothetical protein